MTRERVEFRSGGESDGRPRLVVRIGDALADWRAAIEFARHSTPLAHLRLFGRGVLDALGGALGRPPLLVPLAGERGTAAMLSTPDALDGDKALNGASYRDWTQQVAARSVMRLAWYRPGRHASRVRCPLLVVVCDDDRAAPPSPAVRVSQSARRAARSGDSPAVATHRSCKLTNTPSSCSCRSSCAICSRAPESEAGPIRTARTGGAA